MYEKGAYVAVSICKHYLPYVLFIFEDWKVPIMLVPVIDKVSPFLRYEEGGLKFKCIYMYLVFYIYFVICRYAFIKYWKKIVNIKKIPIKWFFNVWMIVFNLYIS